MRRPRLIGRCNSVAALLLAAAPAFADQVSEDFVALFAETCVPQRLSYQGTLDQAVGLQWLDVLPDAHRELGVAIAKSAAGAAEAEKEGFLTDFRYRVFGRQTPAGDRFLVVSYTASDYINEIGCYLYDFDATKPVSPEPVSALVESEPAQSHSDEAIVAHVWGPPASMPRTLDTYLTFIPPGSPHAETAGFDGVVLKFTTSEPETEQR